MKSTIQLQGDRKAVVDIPYSQLIPHQDKAKETPHACCQSKIVVTGASSRSSSKIDIRRMVQEMEEAYDKDVKALQAKIGLLQHDKAATAAQWEKERRQLQGQFATRKGSYEKEIDLLHQDIRKKDIEIRKVQQQRDLLLRNKISEFRQVEYIDRLNELTHIIRLKDCQIKELGEKYEAVNRDRISIEQHSRSSQLKLQQVISRLSLQLSTTTNSLINQQNNITYASKLKEQQSIKQTQQLKYQLQRADSALREARNSNEAKDQQISSLSHKIKSLQTTVSELESQISQLKDRVLQQTTLKHQLSQEVTVCRRTIVFLNEEKERLLLQLDVRFREIDRLKIDLFERERVYQVKIERVIDSKQQIDQLNTTIFQLQQQITQLNQDKQFIGQDIAKLKKEIQSHTQLRAKLQGEIGGLKAYISKREGSFRWAVERQIQKDIIVSDQRPQTYKVSQIGEYSRLKSEQTNTNKFISQQIGLQMQANLFGNYPQQIVLQKFRQ